MAFERRRSFFHHWCLLLLISFSFKAFGGSGITYHGRLLNSSGIPVTSASVQFKLQIRTPGTQDCLLYEEIQTHDLSATNGVFSLSLGDGSGVRQDSYSWSLFDTLSNRKDFSFSASDCTGVNTYTPAVDDNRKFRVFFDVGSGWEALPLQTINYIPMSIETYAVGGFPASSLFRVEDAGALGSVAALTTTQYNNLVSLADGSSSVYEKSGSLNGSTLPSIGSGESVRWNGTSWESYSPLESGDETDPTVEAFAKTSLPTCNTGEVLKSDGSVLSCVTDTSGTLPDVGTPGTYTKVTTDAKGRVTSGDTLDEADLPNITTAGKVSGDAITSGEISGSTSINTSGNITTTGNITATGDGSSSGVIYGAALQTRRLHIYDDDTNFVTLKTPSNLSADYALTLPVDEGASGQVLSTDGSGTLSWINAATGSVTGVSGTSPIQVSGTTSVTISVDDASTTQKGVVQLASSTDTTAGLVVQADDSRLSDSRDPSGTAGGDLSGTYPNPTVSKIQGISVSTTDPTTAGHVLRYDGSEYTPSFIDVSDIRSNISGLGGDPTFPTSCTTSQTLTWSALTDAFTCSNISISASDVSSTAAGNLSATNVQAALEELDSDISGINTDVSDKVTKSGDTMTGALGFEDSYGIIDEDGNPRLTLSGDKTVIEGGAWGHVVLGSTLMGAQTSYGSLLNITTSSAGADGVGLTVTGELGATGRSSVLIDVDEAQNDRYALRLTAMDQSVEILTATSTGNVGIGTNLPASKLDVQTDGVASSETGIIMRNPSTAAYATTSLDAYTAGAWKSSVWTMRNNTGSGGIFGITTADNTGTGKERLRIDSTGNVGIGTDNPQYKLHVVGDVSIEGNLWGGNLPSTYQTYGDATTAGQWVRIARVEFGEQYQYYSGQFNITAGNPDGSIGIDARAYLRIHQAAAMGSAPNIDLKLDSSTTAFTSSDIVAIATVVTGTQTVVELYGRTQEAWNSLGVQPTNTIYWADATDYSPAAFAASLPAGPQTSAVPGLSFWSLGSTGTSINYSGDVGIGTNNPTAELEVVGTIKATGFEGPLTSTSTSLGDGTVGSPSMTFTNDSDTGFFSSGTDSIGISAGGSQVWDITTSGIISPTAGGAKVSSSNGDEDAPTFSFAGDTDTGWFLAGPDTLAASTGGTERMRIDSSGNVGIGTTAPSGPLDVRGGTAASGSGKSIFLVGQRGGTGNTNGGSIWLAPGAAQGTGTPGVIYLASYDFGAIARFKIQDISANTFLDVEGQTGAAALSAVGGGTSLLLNPTAGNVGIGTSSPAVQATAGRTYLSIKGSTDSGILEFLSGAADANSASVGGIQFTDGNSTAADKRVAMITSNLVGTTANNRGGGLSFYTKDDGVSGLNNRMVVSQSGNVGIGTTNPTSLLTLGIANSTNQEQKVEFRRSNNTTAGGLTSRSDGSGVFRVSMDDQTGAETLSVVSGRVGIGTTDPSSTLEVYGTRRFRVNPTAGIAAFQGDSSGWAMKYGFIGNLGTDHGGFGARGSGDTLAYYWIGPSYTSPTMALASSGDVGIGTTAPGARLHVSDADNTGIGLISGASKGVRIGASATGGQIEGVDSTGFGSYQPLSIGGSDVRFTISSAEMMRINSSGNVGIGTTNPSYKLHVNGSVAGVGAYNALSDRRLKADIRPIENPIEKIMNLQGVRFNWKQDEYPQYNFDRKEDIGVIAQDVEKVLPEAVTTGSDGIKRVAYSKLIAPVIEAIKTLYVRLVGVEDDQVVLEREISSLKAESIVKDRRIQKLENDNALMKNWICSNDPKAEICREM